LAPSVQNWGIGFTVDFAILDLPSIRARRGAETARLDAENARYQKVLADLKAQQDRALAAYEGAVQISQTTPVVVEAARSAVTQARARYQAGLSTALEVADAQRRLAQAEIDDSLAKLEIWRARLAVLAARGDIAPVLAEASR
jgi:outer membrane protein TolC